MGMSSGVQLYLYSVFFFTIGIVSKWVNRIQKQQTPNPYWASWGNELQEKQKPNEELSRDPSSSGGL